MAGHARLAASKTERWKNCPGSLAMEDSIPESLRGGSSVYAQLGTAVHGLVERCLNRGAEPEEFRGRIVELIGPEEEVSILPANARAPREASRVWFEVDGDMIEGAEVMVGYVRRRAEELGAEVSVEHRVRPLSARDDSFGTCDAKLDAWPDVLEIVDYKNGYRTVEVEGNDQIRSYLLGAARDDNFSHELYRATVVQPNADHVAGKVRSEELSAGDLKEYEAELDEAAARVDEADAMFAAGATPAELMDAGHLSAGSHCTWCDAQQSCPAATRMAESLAGADFGEEPRELDAPTTVEAAARLLPWVPFLDDLCRKTEALAQRAAEAGIEVPGQKLVRKRSTGRRFKEAIVLPNPQTGEEEEVELTEDLICSIMTDEFNLGRDKLYTAPEPKLLTGPQMEKLLPKEARKRFSDLLLWAPPGGLTLAPVDDPRPAVEVSPGDDFEEEDF